ncbi:MAG: tetratricopeptide repeat protein [Deltaproteobacteria bacterium]|nr:tetratricopeptide repeat protein [Deltaproteobacteria bacterium]
MSPGRRAAWVVALAGLGAACSAPVLPEPLRRAERFEHDGRREEALTAYAEELRACGSNQPRCGMAAIGRARLLERMGRTEEAIQAYEAVPRLDAHGRTPARGLYRAAELAARQGDLQRALRDAWRAIHEYPNTVPAEDAVRLLVVRMRQAGRARELAEQLGRAAARVKGADVADNLLLAQGDLLERDLDDPAGAIRIWDHLVALYPRSSLYDDAMWRAGQTARRLGDFHGAIERLRVITNQRRIAFFTGSYISEWLDDALLLIGRIYRDDLKDPGHALHAFADLRDNFKTSVLRDDAQLEIARTHVGTGDLARACAALGRLRQDFPRSKHNRFAGAELRARAGCR